MGKMITLKELINLRKTLLKQNVVVLVTGVFDILHVEHIRLLEKAKKEGDILILGIESDKRVKQLKGNRRPVNIQDNRAETIAALNVVDYVFVLPENLNSKKGREKFIGNLKPDIYAVSSNTPYLEEKQRIMKKFKRQLKIVHSYNPQISTSKIIKAMK